MRKPVTAALCICVSLLAAGCGSARAMREGAAACAETAALSVDSQGIEELDFYGDLIEAARECVTGASDIPEGYDFSVALIMAGNYSTPGYLVEDIDGNGIRELIIGGNDVDPADPWDGVIYDIYTVSDGELIHVAEGWERNRYFLCENGMIANESSGSAYEFKYAYFAFEETKLHLVEAVICNGTEDAADPWYYTTALETAASFGTDNAEAISEERAAEIMEKYVYGHPEFVPFAG